MKKAKDIPPRHRGIPRTLKTALALGYKKKRVKFADVKRNFVQFAAHGARAGSVCGHAPSSRVGYISVCYKNDLGICTWVDVPEADPIGH
jgi:hypothetical protein